jgi:hypothetical protein
VIDEKAPLGRKGNHIRSKKEAHHKTYNEMDFFQILGD